MEKNTFLWSESKTIGKDSIFLLAPFVYEKRFAVGFTRHSMCFHNMHTHTYAHKHTRTHADTDTQQTLPHMKADM